MNCIDVVESSLVCIVRTHYKFSHRGRPLNLFEGDCVSVAEMTLLDFVHLSPARSTGERRAPAFQATVPAVQVSDAVESASF